jgi:hypothetical protein
MAENEEQLERLKVRLQWEGAGPLIDLSNQAATRCCRDCRFWRCRCGRLRRSDRSSVFCLLPRSALPSDVGDPAVRSINLLKIAAEAELLRLRTVVARQGRRAAFGIIAFIFVLGVLVLAEAAGWQALRIYVVSIVATLILLGVNLIIAGIFGVLAARSSPGHVEREALRVRRQALEAARGSMAFTAAVPLGQH